MRISESVCIDCAVIAFEIPQGHHYRPQQLADVLPFESKSVSEPFTAKFVFKYRVMNEFVGGPSFAHYTSVHLFTDLVVIPQ